MDKHSPNLPLKMREVGGRDLRFFKIGGSQECGGMGVEFKMGDGKI